MTDRDEEIQHLKRLLSERGRVLVERENEIEFLNKQLKETHHLLASALDYIGHHHTTGVQ